MNTKQVEELVGISRQNIRYYEKAGLLTPCREQQNSYRDYSAEDVERLKLIKMLRMLDMPLKEIEKVIKEEISIQEAVSIQQGTLQEQQKQLQAAIDICNLLKKEKTQEINIDKYLNKMEHMESNGNVFAKIRDDYKQIILEEEGKQIVFYTDCRIHTSADFEKILKEYAKTQGVKFKIREKGKYPKFYLNDALYQAVYSFENPEYRIVCMKIHDVEKEESFLSLAYRGTLVAIHSMIANIRRHSIKSVCSFAISFLLILLLGIYMGNLNQIYTQIEELPTSVPVYGSIYNSSGESYRHLLIKEAVVEGVRNSGYVDQVEETVELITKDESGQTYQILALEDEELEGLKQGQCLADPLFLKNSGLEVGDQITLPIYCYVADLMMGRLTEHLMTEVKLEIAGTREMEESLHLPLSDAKKLFEESGSTYSASSLSFRVKEPEALNALKAEMKELGLQQIQSGAKDSYYGTALGIEDATFIEASMKLENNKTLLQSFLPIVLLLLLVAEYLIAYLFLQSRRQEFAIMRALGKSKGECSRSLLAEQLILNLAGTIAGSIVCWLVVGLEVSVIIPMIAVFMVIAVIGVYSAIWMLGRFSVSAVLTRRD